MNHLIGCKKLETDPILNRKIYATFDGRRSQNLPKLCLDLLSEQKTEWPDLREGCESLKDARERVLDCRGFSVRLQFNPRRIKSTTAALEEKEGKERQCFLCLGHLPQGQKGILYRSQYFILCNPMPIFPYHFTVSHVHHRLQSMFENVDIFLQLMADFGSAWTILYNGPRCGASAPDHLHFQIAPSGKMPIEKEIRGEKRPKRIRRPDGVLLYRLRDLGREVIVLEGENPMAIGNAFKSFLNALKKLVHTAEEPMMNMAGFYKETKWRLIIFPRQKHRPDAFFRDGNARVLVSPGVIDMGGLVITPMEKDFERLNGADVESIYGEVSLERRTVEKAIDAYIENRIGQSAESMT